MYTSSLSYSPLFTYSACTLFTVVPSCASLNSNLLPFLHYITSPSFLFNVFLGSHILPRSWHLVDISRSQYTPQFFYSALFTVFPSCVSLDFHILPYPTTLLPPFRFCVSYYLSFSYSALSSSLPSLYLRTLIFYLILLFCPLSSLRPVFLCTLISSLIPLFCNLYIVPSCLSL
jgi:hypothetical protein